MARHLNCVCVEVKSFKEPQSTFMPTESSSSQQAGAQEAPSQPFAHVLTRNISTLVDLRREADQKKSRQDAIADTITRFAGSMAFVYLHLMLFSSWIAINVGWIPFIKKFDPSLVVLAMFASVEAIFLSTFVLISQNRMAAAQDQRAELDLQISLLAEHEITQVLNLLDDMARQMGIQRPANPQFEDAKHDVDPAVVLEAIEQHEQEAQAKSTND
jgi:uncharacterized membrane protein